MNELHLFAGAGGGILGGILLGHAPVCAVEIEPYCRQVLLQRQRDGVLPRVVRMAYGVGKRVDRIRALGNGQVPAVAAMAWRILTNEN